MKKNLIIAVLMTLVTTVLFGLLFPLVITGLAQVLFPKQANGELVTRNGRVIGSRLIGQSFSSPGYFHSRRDNSRPSRQKQQRDPKPGSVQCRMPAILAVVYARLGRVRLERLRPSVDFPCDIVLNRTGRALEYPGMPRSARWRVRASRMILQALDFLLRKRKPRR